MEVGWWAWCGIMLAGHLLMSTTMAVCRSMSSVLQCILLTWRNAVTRCLLFCLLIWFRQLIVTRSHGHLWWPLRRPAHRLYWPLKSTRQVQVVFLANIMNSWIAELFKTGNEIVSVWMQQNCIQCFCEEEAEQRHLFLRGCCTVTVVIVQVGICTEHAMLVAHSSCTWWPVTVKLQCFEWHCCSKMSLQKCDSFCSQCPTTDNEVKSITYHLPVVSLLLLLEVLCWCLATEVRVYY